MMKIFKLLLVLLTFSIGVSAQTASELVGDWNFAEVHNPENKLDEESLTLFTEFFGKTNFVFEEDGTFTAVVGQRIVKGEYSYNEDTKFIVMTSKEGKEDAVYILSFEGDIMAVQMGREAGKEGYVNGMIMKRK